MQSLGPDGFTANFYQKYWQVVKQDVIAMVRSFFLNGFLLRQMNHANLLWIPKAEKPMTMGQFRPISLCNVSYKIILKISVGRLRSVLPKLISGSQNYFVPNRQIQENIILVHESMYTLKRKQGHGGLMMAKIDVEKAYDKVDWGFFFY